MFWGLPILVGVCGRSLVELGSPYRYRYIPYNSADSEAPGERSQSNLTQFCCSKTCLALGSWGVSDHAQLASPKKSSHGSHGTPSLKEHILYVNTLLFPSVPTQVT